MSMTGHTRRRFLISAGAMSVAAPVATAFGLQLAAAGQAASQSATDYKALVCIFQLGGNDSHNTVLATDADSWGRYWTSRNTGADPIALMPAGTAPVAVGDVSPVTGRTASLRTPENWGGVLPIVPDRANPVPAGTNATTRTFGLHPMLAPLLPVWTAGRLAVLANVGTLINPITKAQYESNSARYPAALFSHNDQQSLWQAGATEGARAGWGGQLADRLASLNGQNTLFTAMSASGNTVFLSGGAVSQYIVSTGNTPAVVITSQNGATLFGSSAAPGQLRDMIQGAGISHDLGLDHGGVVQRSILSAGVLNTAASGTLPRAVPGVPAFTNPVTGAVETNQLAVQLQTVARMIAAGPALGMRRQVFFVAMGNHDSHDFQNVAQPANLAKLAQAMALFDSSLADIGGADMRPAVTAFTASDFSRTFTTNGDGTDHAWGGHHFMMGGAVAGRNIYGQYPTLGVDLGSFRNPDMTRSSLVPTTSVDQFAATLGAWFGVPSGDLNMIFPNLRNFPTANLGFMRP